MEYWTGSDATGGLPIGLAWPWLTVRLPLEVARARGKVATIVPTADVQALDAAVPRPPGAILVKATADLDLTFDFVIAASPSEILRWYSEHLAVDDETSISVEFRLTSLEAARLGRPLRAHVNTDASLFADVPLVIHTLAKARHRSPLSQFAQPGNLPNLPPVTRFRFALLYDTRAQARSALATLSHLPAMSASK